MSSGRKMLSNVIQNTNERDCFLSIYPRQVHDLLIYGFCFRFTLPCICRRVFELCQSAFCLGQHALNLPKALNFLLKGSRILRDCTFCPCERIFLGLAFTFPNLLELRFGVRPLGCRGSPFIIDRRSN